MVIKYKPEDGGWYYVPLNSVMRANQLHKVITWCVESFGKYGDDTWWWSPDETYGQNYLIFRNESEASWFLLKWQ